MVTATNMPIERPHQYKILLSEDEKAWLEEIATSRGLTAADVLRQYIREAHAALVASQGVTLGREHQDLLFAFSDGSEAPQSSEELAIWMNRQGYGAGWHGFGRILNELREIGYLRRLAAGYLLTAEGKAYVQSRWRPSPKTK